MMLSGKKGPNALNLFNWNQQGESSLTTGLLNEVSPEIELSDYRRAPSSGSESPSGLFNSEDLKVETIADLDLFFERLYSYYCEKGLWCIIIKWIFELLSLAFTICFSGFFLLFVDWNGLRNAKCGMDAVESGIKPCDLSKEALHEHPLVPFTLTKAIIVGYLGIFSVYWFFCFLRFFSQLKDILKIRDFYHNSLFMSDNEIQTLPWALILGKVLQIQSSQQLCVVKDLSVHDVVMRLMRKENYMIGMINKGVLAFPISSWVLGVGPTTKVGPDGVQYRLILTKTLEWTLNWCILQSMFDRNFRIRSEFINDSKTLKKRLMIVGFLMLLLSPFLVIFMLVYLFLRHAEQFYNHPSTASSRRWSNLSKWMFREFNEVDHLFKHRINNSVVHASEYLKQFPSPMITIVAKFISFVSGGFAAILIIIAFLEESLLEGHIFGRNLFWYAAVFGTITAISRAAVADELLVLDPEGMMSLVVQHTHYMPKRWRGKENTEAVRMEFETLFQYTGMMLLEEMASIFLTPYLLLFVVPKRVKDIQRFVAKFTKYVEGVGDVCSFSLFDFPKHGNRRYGSPSNTEIIQSSSEEKMDKSFWRSSQGKMEKSFLSFQSSYPSWKPNAEGKQFLQNLEKFREQALQVQATRPAYVSSRTPQRTLSHRALGDRNSFTYRDSPLNNIRAAYDFSSAWPMDNERKDFPYILDYYYTSQGQQAMSDVRPSSASGVATNLTQNTGACDGWRQDDDDIWDNLLQGRKQSPLEASTSAPLFGESVLRQDDLNDRGIPGSGQWWRRMGANPHASFLEPPNFNGEESYDDNDNPSCSSVGEPEHLHWNASRLSRTFMVDDDGGEFSLPFDDIYRRQSESPKEYWDPEDIV